MRLALYAWYLTRFHESFQPAQILAQHEARAFIQESCDYVARSKRWAVYDIRFD
jgi:hypothetical protein